MLLSLAAVSVAAVGRLRTGREVVDRARCDRPRGGRRPRSQGGAALVPALDLTRNVGLVVLPGAFVGLLLAGATPLEAGRLQLLVLVGLLCAESVAVVAVTHLLGGRLGPSRPRSAGTSR